jgi:anti-sigma B factor antagonist
MSLEIEQREREGVIVLDLKGRITIGPEVSAFRGAFERIVEAEPRLILNMRGVDYIDSTGLGALVMCSTRLRSVQGTTKLIHMNRRNIELLVMTRIDAIFEVFDDETDAVNSFFPGREIKRFDILNFVQNLREE